MSKPAVQVRQWTREEYDRLIGTGFFQPGERLELIEGEVVEMTPQGSVHAAVTGRAERALQQQFGPNCWVRVQMPLALGDLSEPEPDLAVVQGTPDDYLDHHPGGAQTLLVIEVSDTTLDYDREKKARVYARVGIREYWLVNLVDRCVEVYRDPVKVGAAEAAYQECLRIESGRLPSPLCRADVTIRTEDLLP